MNFKQMALLFWKAQPDEEENHVKAATGNLSQRLSEGGETVL